MRSNEYLKLLGDQYSNIGEVISEIINLKAILNLPKGTEHFLTDIHGEYEAFAHHLRTASGLLKFKVDDIFGFSISQEDKEDLTTLMFYPEEKLRQVKKERENLEDWYRINIYRLISICKVVSSKYTRSKVRKALPKEFAYILDELLNLEATQLNKEEYYHQIIDTVIELKRSSEFIVAISSLIQRLAVDKLHILGDIYDRGAKAHMIMDHLLEHHDVDIQWGNHDILWMGASMGNPIMVATALRIALRYGNLESIEEGYGINLLPLGSFAMREYQGDPCVEFLPRLNDNQYYREKDKELIAKMHKAIAMIQFKLEGQAVERRKDFDMEGSKFLHKVDYEKGELSSGGKTYKLTSNKFPTIDLKDPYKLSEDEQDVIDKLTFYFTNSEKLQKHTHLLFTNGSLYLKYNGNLLYHGCIPLTANGDYESLVIDGKAYKGRALMDKFEERTRYAYFNKDLEATDWLWYLWCGKMSPLFGKYRMATFERYFIEDKGMHKEKLNPYFSLREKEEVCSKILKDFNLDPCFGKIINGHTPIKEKNGESPIKAGSKLLVIDGGLSRAYQSKTGIAGYTLIYNSWGMLLVSHTPFTSVDSVLENGIEIKSSRRVVEKTERKKVADTDIGKGLKAKIDDLKELLEAYRRGDVKES